MAGIVKGKNPNRPYTVRYRDSLGKQREKSFRTRREAQDFRTDQEKAKQYGADVNLTAQKNPFNDAVERHLARMRPGSTRRGYESAYRTWVRPAYAGKSVTEAARGTDLADQLVNAGRLAKRHKMLRSRVLTLIVRTLDGLVSDGTLQTHRVRSVELHEIEYDSGKTGFTYVTADDATRLAERCGLWVTLQYRLGLRVSEALGLHRDDFAPSINGGAVLHLARQASRDGKSRVPLKAKGLTGYRDIPVPADVWESVKSLPDGALFPGRKNPYRSYSAAAEQFRRASAALSCGEIGTHQLRHAFATRMIQKGMNIVMLAKILGHSSTEITFQTYVHVMPSDLETAGEMMAA